MNGNQGLEALAALCGGEAAAVANTNNSTRSQEAVLSPVTGSQGAPGAIERSNLAQMTMGQSGITQQQWQQAVAAAAALGAGGAAATTAAAPTPNSVSSAVSALFGAAHNAAPAPSIADPLVAMQQLAYYRYIQDQATAAAQKVVQIARDGQNNVHPFVRNNPAVALALAGQAQQQLQNQLADAARQQVLPPAAAPSPNASAAQHETSMSMPPPNTQGTSSLSSTLSTAGIASSATPIAPLPGVRADNSLSMSDSVNSGEGFGGDKKQQKRAANRRSAQLSRKRKKQFIEELKDENDELRRKEQILKSIPDLIVVFDSTGKLWFVSQSVSRFLDMTAKELEGSSFWDRLCEDSVRLLKAAFMDSLAARRDESDTAPLGSGVWELRLVDKDGSFKLVTLNGVVHFSGDRPECVCSIRPSEESPVEQQKSIASKSTTAKALESGSGASANGATVSNGTTSGDEPATKVAKKSSIHYRPLLRAKPQQSVISRGSSAGASSASSLGVGKQKPPRGKRREAARISDGDSVSADSGSSDELGE